MQGEQVLRDFDLVSVDWDTVRLMQAGQFKQETFYLEEMVRWALQRGRLSGLLHLADNGISRPSPEGPQTYSLSVRGCYAVGREGYLIEIPDDRHQAVQGLIEARAAAVPLFVGVAKTRRESEPELRPSVDTGLLGCGGRRRGYRLATDDADDGYDWLQVALFEKTAAGLALDPYFLPDCVFLSSHVGLWSACRDIARLARQALDTLEKNATNAPPVYAAAAALAGSLGPAARLEDERLHPRAYLDRLSGIFAAQRSQLTILPNPHLTVYQEALNALGAALAYLDGDWALGEALRLARECLERLWKVYPALLQSLEAAVPPPPVQTAEWDKAAPAPRPGLPADLAAQGARPEPRRAAEPEAPPASAPRPNRSIWRK